MSPALTRRGLVHAGAVSLGVIVAGSPVTTQAAPDPDAELFRLIAQEDAARTAWRATSDALDAALDREMRRRPRRPDALQSGFLDYCRGLGAAPSGKVQLPNGNYRAFWRDEDVEALKRAPLPTRWAIGEADAPPRREPDPDGEARHREIIAAYDAWKADRKTIEDAVGLTAATIADGEVGRALTAAEDCIEACRARTIQGLGAKGRMGGYPIKERRDRDDFRPVVRSRGRGVLWGDVVRRALSFVAWAALVALAVVWWSPSILLAVAALAADQARFRALLAWVGLLRMLGRRDAARRTLDRALRRCEARRQALAVRCPR